MESLLLKVGREDRKKKGEDGWKIGGSEGALVLCLTKESSVEK